MLTSKLALITGSASGIGKSISKLFAKNGANLCLIDTNLENLNKLVDEIRSDINQNLNISIHKCDVSDGRQVEDLFLNIRKINFNQPCPNVIVNSAGIIRDNFMIKMTEQDFDKVISVNLKGTFLISQQACKNLLEVNSLDKSKNINSSIINIASVIGKYGNLGQANYSASKAGVEGLTRTIAKEMGKYQIRCNAILPGFIRTPMTEHVPNKVSEQMSKMIPLRRLGEPEDVAQLALFLASDSSSYITGASIECSGGIAF